MTAQRQIAWSDRFAWAAFALGLPSAVISTFWGLGGIWLLDTVGGALEENGRAGNPALIAVVWLAVLLKLVASLIGVAAVRSWFPTWARLTRIIGWMAGAILFLYGLVLTAGGILVEIGVISASADADRRAIRWHAFFWDPWFLLWGGCLLLAMALSRGDATSGSSMDALA